MDYKEISGWIPFPQESENLVGLPPPAMPLPKPSKWRPLAMLLLYTSLPLFCLMTGGLRAPVSLARRLACTWLMTALREVTAEWIGNRLKYFLDTHPNLSPRHVAVWCWAAQSFWSLLLSYTKHWTQDEIAGTVFSVVLMEVIGFDLLRAGLAATATMLWRRPGKS